MTRRLPILIGLGLLTASASAASPPSASTSSHQNTPLRLVGYRATAIDPAGTFTVTVRGLGGNLMPNVQVSILFANCTDTHIGVAAYQSGGSGGLSCADCQNPLTVDAANRRVTAITNSSGVAVFDVVGSVTRSRSPVVAEAVNGVAKCAEIWFLAFNEKLDNLQVVTFDQDGANGVDAIDLSLWAQDFYGIPPNSSLRAASDYDAAGNVDGVDLALWAAEFFSGNSIASAPAYAW